MLPFSFPLARLAPIRRPMFWVGMLAGLVASGFVVLCALVLLQGKRDAEHQADEAAANTADIIAHDTARTFEFYDLSLRGVIRRLEDPATAALTGRARQLALFDAAASATYLQGIRVLDAAGNVTDDSRALVPTKQNFADQGYFRVHENSPYAGLYVSRPLESTVGDGEWLIALSRRISNPDGSFAGVVVGTLDLDYFQSLFANLSLGASGEVSVLRNDGTLLARKPFRLTAIGRNFRNASLFQYYPAAAAGHFISTAVLDRISRQFAFRRVDNLPVVVSVGFSGADIYARWERRAMLIAALITGLALAKLALAALLSREFVRRKRADALSREREARYRILADNSSDAMVLRTPMGTRKYATPAFYQMIDRSAENMEDKRLIDFLHPTSRKATENTLMRLRGGEPRVTQTLQCRRPDGSWMWLESISSAVFDASGTMTEIVSNLRDVTCRKITEDQLATAASTDGLTGLANRRAFDERLTNEWKRARRSRSPLALLMIDVDHFKAYNDEFGHLQGDEALRIVAQCINSKTRRPADLAARYGGEEFAVILPETDDDGAARVSENIRCAVADRALAHPHSPTTTLTVSIGIANLRPGSHDELLNFVRDADTALYRAKRDGRNRIELSVAEMTVAD